MAKRITKFQFQAFPHAARPDTYDDIIDEREWYADEEECTLAPIHRKDECGGVLKE